MPDNLQQISKLLDEKLAPIQKTLGEHGKILRGHGKILSDHGEMLRDQREALREHGEILKEHSKTLNGHGKILIGHGKLLKSLKKDQDTMLSMLDKEQMDQRKRLTRVEERLRLHPSAA